MPDVLSFNPSRALDAAADGSPGAKAFFYDSGTTTLRTVYSDAACTVPHASPLVADATGSFAAVFSNAAAIKVVVTDSAGVTLSTIDPCIRVPATGAAASSISFTPTGALPFDNVQAAIEGSVAAAASGYNAFGLGVTGSVALLANLDATNTASGQYRFDGTTTGTFPSGVVAANTGAIVVVRETSSSAWMNLYHDTTNRQWTRRMNASAWGAWREVPNGVALVTSTDTIAANNNDTTIPTSAAVKAYADGVSPSPTKVKSITVGGGSSVQTVTFLNLGGYGGVSYIWALSNGATVQSAILEYSIDGGSTWSSGRTVSLAAGGSLLMFGYFDFLSGNLADIRSPVSSFSSTLAGAPLAVNAIRFRGGASSIQSSVILQLNGGMS